ncbi:hypothetical protein LCGC14_0524340 [marine sediment metagenome]|uniref:Schlafen AlbA-2 domain-containing protein n=1 Tax=marine sediment metagenome TaxID=412755 RepID=A0A0F9V5M2_9ZZZZ
MLITPDQFDEVNQDFLESLINNGIEENIHLEYKEQLGSNAEIAKDISSFANSDGGNIIYGMQEVNNKPTEIKPMSQLKLREKLDQITRNGIDPSLDVRILPIDVTIKTNEGQVFLIWIPRKYPILRQAVKFAKYYKRTEFTCSPMSNFEIETAFKLAYNYEERINSIFQNRLNKLNFGEYYVNIPSQTRMFIHMISIDTLETHKFKDLEIVFNEFEKYLKPPSCLLGRNIERNLDGLLVSCGPDPYSGNYVGYVQLYRNGMIESIDSSLLFPTNHLHGKKYMKPVKKLGMWYLEENIIRSCEMYLKTLEKIGAGLPIYLFLSFTHIKGYKISLIPYGVSLRIDSDITKRDDILLPRIKIDSFEIEIEEKLKTSFDIFWNAFNEPCSRNYNEKGKFIKQLLNSASN